VKAALEVRDVSTGTLYAAKTVIKKDFDFQKEVNIMKAVRGTAKPITTARTSLGAGRYSGLAQTIQIQKIQSSEYTPFHSIVIES